MVEAVDAVSFAPNVRTAIEHVRTALEMSWRDASTELKTNLRRWRFGPAALATTLKQLESCAVGQAPRLAVRSRSIATRLQRHLDKRLRDLFQKEAAEKDSNLKSRLGYERHDTQKFLSVSEDVTAALRPLTEPLQQQVLVVRGEWGTGKTHSLCDIVAIRMRARLPALLVLGQQLASRINPLDAIAAHTGLAATGESLLRQLDRMGRAKRTRALLMVDAINEGDRTAWRQHLTAVIREVRKYPHVSLVVSCRRPFDDEIITARSASQVAFIEHRGFADIEFDAQLTFFRHYRLQAPQFPLLDDEFARPLFLKILCKSLVGLTVRNQHRQLRTFASGQRGMTQLLERFVLETGDAIERRFQLKGKTCWQILKGARPYPAAAIDGIAPRMAAAGTNAIPRDEALAIISLFVTAQRVAVPPADVLRAMMTEGLLAEDVQWSSEARETVVRLPYERFSDHLIARHLLEQFLDTTSPATIAQSLAAANPLANVFAIAKWSSSYAMPGVASAIMLEFPERVRNHVPDGEVELVFYLPEERRLLEPFRRAFLQGLHWRSAESFTPQTRDLISRLLESRDDGPDEVYEVLVGLATRPGHPLSAGLLFENLSKMTMVERDLAWTEFIRNAEPTSVIFKLVAWVEQLGEVEVSSEAAESALTVLAMVLTTTRRPLRDATTRALVLLGERFPAELFALTLRGLTFNDPYVAERLLAACYGVAMRGWADPAAKRLAAVLGLFARDLALALYVPPAAAATAHALIRDCVQGIVALARKVQPSCLPRRWLKFLKTPATSVPYMPQSGAVPTDAQRQETEPALHMDFDNYTLGHLVGDRGNYQFEHAGYIDVRNRLLIRMAELGYTYTRFKNLDVFVGERNWNSQDAEKTDRYGKKYSWIAFFELYAVQQDRGLLSDWRGSRPSESDIDPSFPDTRQSTWRVPLDDVFSGTP